MFAYTNYAWQNGNNPNEENDGILTACKTGLGDIEGSERVYGLTRAFKMAGVKTIIMSLWPVSDLETAGFMSLFYRSWKEYNNPKKAFKESQQKNDEKI